MKKITIYVLTAVLLCALSLAVLLYAHGQLTARGEDVTVTETTLFGDQKEAEGITVETETRFFPETSISGKYLQWNTACSVEEHSIQSKVKLAFTAHNAYNNVSTEESSSADLSMDLQTGSLGSDDLLKEMYSDEFGFNQELADLVLQLAEQTAAGKTKKKTIRLKDYMKSFPVSYGVYIATGEEWANCALDGQPTDYSYFDFPVPDDLKLTLVLSKNTAGKVTDLTVETAGYDGDPFLHSQSAYDPNGYLYTAITGVTMGEQKLPVSPAMCGIHRIPLNHGKKLPTNLHDTFWADMAHAEKVCDLRPEQSPLKLAVDPTGRELLLLTKESDGSIQLSVFHTKDMKLQQKLTVLENLTDLSQRASASLPDIIDLRWQDDGILIIVNNYDFAWVRKISDSYVLDVSDTLAKWLPASNYPENISAVCRGSQMVLAMQPGWEKDGEYTSALSHYLLVYKDSRLVYTGFYENSLDQQTYSQFYPIYLDIPTEKKEASQ